MTWFVDEIGSLEAPWPMNTARGALVAPAPAFEYHMVSRVTALLGRLGTLTQTTVLAVLTPDSIQCPSTGAPQFASVKTMSFASVRICPAAISVCVLTTKRTW